VNEVEFLDRIRGIAQLGLTYARDPYDQQRYTELLKLATDGYEPLTGLPAAEITDRLRAETGYITAKAGVDGAVFDDTGERLLLIRRADTGTWALPGGWVDPGQTPEDAVVRELFEETRLSVNAGSVIAVSSQLPRPGGSPHTSVHVLYACTITAGTPQTTGEAAELGFHRPADITDWHEDHGQWAAKAMRWRTSR